MLLALRAPAVRMPSVASGGGASAAAPADGEDEDEDEDDLVVLPRASLRAGALPARSGSGYMPYRGPLLALSPQTAAKTAAEAAATTPHLPAAPVAGDPSPSHAAACPDPYASAGMLEAVDAPEAWGWREFFERSLLPEEEALPPGAAVRLLAAAVRGVVVVVAVADSSSSSSSSSAVRLDPGLAAACFAWCGRLVRACLAPVERALMAEVEEEEDDQEEEEEEENGKRGGRGFSAAAAAARTRRRKAAGAPPDDFAEDRESNHGQDPLAPRRALELTARAGLGLSPSPARAGGGEEDADDEAATLHPLANPPSFQLVDEAAEHLPALLKLLGQLAGACAPREQRPTTTSAAPPAAVEAALWPALEDEDDGGGNTAAAPGRLSRLTSRLAPRACARADPLRLLAFAEGCASLGPLRLAPRAWRWHGAALLRAALPHDRRRQWQEQGRRPRPPESCPPELLARVSRAYAACDVDPEPRLRAALQDAGRRSGRGLDEEAERAARARRARSWRRRKTMPPGALLL